MLLDKVVGKGIKVFESISGMTDCDLLFNISISPGLQAIETREFSKENGPEMFGRTVVATTNQVSDGRQSHRKCSLTSPTGRSQLWSWGQGFALGGGGC